MKANPVGRCMAAKPVPGRRGLLICVLPMEHPTEMHLDESGMFAWSEADQYDHAKRVAS